MQFVFVWKGHRGVIHSLTDYEEDFEADEEGPVEDGEEKKDGKGPSPSLQKEEEEKEKHFELDSEVEEKGNWNLNHSNKSMCCFFLLHYRSGYPDSQLVF